MKFPDRYNFAIIAVIIVFALLARIIFVAIFFTEHLYFDEEVYDLLAKNLILGLGYGYAPGELISWRPPLYPFFLAGIYAIFGRNLLVVKIIQALLSAIACFFIFKVSEEIYDCKVARISLLVSACYPLLIYWNKFLLTESLYVFLITFLIWQMLIVAKTNLIKYQVVCGITLGIACLTRPETLFYLPIFLLWMAFYRKDSWRAYFKRSAVVFIVMTLTIFPWSLRNYLVHKQFVLITTNGGWNIWLPTAQPLADGKISDPLLKAAIDFNYEGAAKKHSLYLQEQIEKIDKLSEAKRDQGYKDLSLFVIRNNFKGFLMLAKKKILIFWSPFVPRAGFNPQKHYPVLRNFRFFLQLEVLVFALVALGLILSINNRKTWLFILLFILYTFAAAIFYPWSRYRTALIPWIIVLFSKGSWEIYKYLFKTKLRVKSTTFRV